MSMPQKRKHSPTPIAGDCATAKRRLRTSQSSHELQRPKRQSFVTTPHYSSQVNGPRQTRSRPSIIEPELASSSEALSLPAQPKHRSISKPHHNEPVLRGSRNRRDTPLRYSFTATSMDSDDQNNITPQDQPLDQSFSVLNVTKEESTPSIIYQEISLPTQIVPLLSKPSKKREGYGFSYTESLWCESDYPDTECDWGLEEQTKQDGAMPSKSKEQSASQFQLVQASFGGSTVVDEDFSLDDFVVVRDVESFHMARPQTILPCTQATREDTIRLRTQAQTMLGKYTESSDIQGQLLSRLERMVYNELQKQHKGAQPDAASFFQCLQRLYDFLTRIRDERIETGDHPRFVDHELEWAKWLVEAGRTGVLHLKTVECTCKPDWEEQSNVEGV